MKDVKISAVSIHDFAEIKKSKHPENYFIVASYMSKGHSLALIRGDGQKILVPCDWFKSNPVCKPDFNDLEIIDCGQTIRLGKYEAASDAILKEFG